jgi:hypothetical protein
MSRMRPGTAARALMPAATPPPPGRAPPSVPLPSTLTAATKAGEEDAPGCRWRATMRKSRPSATPVNATSSTPCNETTSPSSAAGKGSRRAAGPCPVIKPAAPGVPMTRDSGIRAAGAWPCHRDSSGSCCTTCMGHDTVAPSPWGTAPAPEPEDHAGWGSVRTGAAGFTLSPSWSPKNMNRGTWDRPPNSAATALVTGGAAATADSAVVFHAVSASVATALKRRCRMPQPEAHTRSAVAVQGVTSNWPSPQGVHGRHVGDGPPVSANHPARQVHVAPSPPPHCCPAPEHGTPA